MTEQQPKPAKWRRWLIETILILMAIIAIHAWQHKDVRTGAAPSIQGISVAGNAINLSDFTGQPLLIHFFAPWCPVCVANHDNISRIAQHYPVLMIAVQTDPQALNAWLKAHPEDNPAHILTDPNGSLLASFGAKALPTNVFINADGNIITTELGYTTTLGLWLRLAFS
jgi:thiol-disulfide isomerase/thioredoxin